MLKREHIVQSHSGSTGERILAEARVADVRAAAIGEQRPVPAEPSGQHAIEHVHARGRRHSPGPPGFPRPSGSAVCLPAAPRVTTSVIAHIESFDSPTESPPMLYPGASMRGCRAGVHHAAVRRWIPPCTMAKVASSGLRGAAAFEPAQRALDGLLRRLELRLPRQHVVERHGDIHAKRAPAPPSPAPACRSVPSHRCESGSAHPPRSPSAAPQGRTPGIRRCPRGSARSSP